jgi:chemotaxis signal transduction protein
MQYLLFQASSRLYAIPASEIDVVLPVPKLSESPMGPDWLLGCIRYRGDEIPVVDMAKLSGANPTAPLISTRLIVVREREGGQSLALLVEHALEVMALEPCLGQRASEAEPWLYPELLHKDDDRVGCVNWAFLLKALP